MYIGERGEEEGSVSDQQGQESGYFLCRRHRALADVGRKVVES